MNLKKIKDTLTPTDVVGVLNQLLAEELQAAYDYFKVSPFLVGLNRPDCSREFSQHAYEEIDHASLLIDRINVIGGQCAVTSLEVAENMARGAATCGSMDVEVQCALNRDAELVAIQHYNEAIEYIGDFDLVTRDILKKILKDEEMHQRELQEFIDDLEKLRNESK